MTYEDNLQKVLEAARLLAATLTISNRMIPGKLTEEQQQAFYVLRNMFSCELCGPGIVADIATVCRGDDTHNKDDGKERCKCCHKEINTGDLKVTYCDQCLEGDCPHCDC